MVTIRQQLLIDVSDCRMSGISFHHCCVCVCVDKDGLLKGLHIPNWLSVMGDIAFVLLPTAQSVSQVVLWLVAFRDLIG